MTTATATTTAILSAAIAARKDSVSVLRARLSDILMPIPIGTVLADQAGEVCKIVHLCTGASQWANSTWEVTIRGWGAVAEGMLLCADLESVRWDGHNMHRHSTEPICLGSRENHQVLSYLDGAATRYIANRLPAAIAFFIAECEEEARRNLSAASKL
jgi:hypothetical protein